MTAGETTTYLLGQLALPPTSLVGLALVGIVMARWRPRAGTAMAAVSLLALLLLSTTVAARFLVQAMEPPPLTAANRAGAQAIVILAGGRVRESAEWRSDTVNAATLRRLRYGAHLARETGLPVLLSGGDPDATGVPEAKLMQTALERDFGVRARWIEDRSQTTAENARLSATMLAAQGITRVLLVTDAVHMTRARRAFAAAGLTTVPAATGYVGNAPFRWQHLVPNAEAMRLSNLALREWVAGLWYRLRR